MKNEIITASIIEIKKCKTEEDYLKLDSLIEKTVKAIISNDEYVITYKEDFKYIINIILKYFKPELSEKIKLHFLLRKLDKL